MLLFMAATADAVDPRDPRFSHTVYLQPYSKLRQAAELGDPEAQYDLAYLYYKADSDPEITGVIQSDKLAAQWYRKAAVQGHTRAQYNMAVLYLQGDGVDRDPVEAYAWLLQSSGGGHQASLELMEELNGVLNDKQINEARERTQELGVSSPPS
jgi:TPR repeat protein